MRCRRHAAPDLNVQVRWLAAIKVVSRPVGKPAMNACGLDQGRRFPSMKKEVVTSRTPKLTAIEVGYDEGDDPSPRNPKRSSPEDART
jgi:hypothetical protein